MRLALSVLVLGVLLTGCASSRVSGAPFGATHDSAPDRVDMARFAEGGVPIAPADSLPPVLREIARPVALVETLPDTAGLGLSGYGIGVQRRWGVWTEAEDGGPMLIGASLEVLETTNSYWSPRRAEVVLFDVDRDGALEADRVLGARLVTVGGLRGVAYPSQTELFGDSTFVLHIGPRRRLVARGTDLALVRNLIGRVDPSAVEAVERVPTWIEALPPLETWRAPFFRGLLAREDEVLAVSGDPRPFCEGHRGRCPQQPSATVFRPLAGWVVSGRPPEGEGLPVGIHVATLYSEADPSVGPAGASRLTITVQASGGAAGAPLDWLVEWDGFAASKLPWWTTDLDPEDPPARRAFGSHDGVQFALRGEIGGAPGHVEAGLVPVGDWLLLVLGTGRPEDAATLRAAVGGVAATLRVGGS